MIISAQDIIGAWVELDRTAPYHTDQKPIGHDRKQHEGPLSTNDDFENTWMPTKEPEAAEQCQQEQIEVVQVEIAAMRKRADEQYVLPGVSERLWNAWEQTHETGMEFQSSMTFDALEKFLHYLVQFAMEAKRIGVPVDPGEVKVLERYADTHPPNHGDGYTPAKANEILYKLDLALGRLHTEVARITGTEKEQWYEIQAENMKGLLHDQMQVMNLTPEEEAELGIKNRLSPQKLRDQRGPGAPFLEDMWQRRKRNELVGMRIRAIDVQRQKQQPQTPPDEEFLSMNPEETPPETHPGLDDFRQMTQDNPLAEHNPEVLAQTIGEAGEWFETDSEVVPAGSVFSYSKDINLDEDYEHRLEIIAFVMPLAARKKILMDRAKDLRKSLMGGRNDPLVVRFEERAREFEEEAMNTPDRGYISDIEVSYREELLFHRERSFVPKGQPLTQREFMSGDALQRATSDIQQFIRTKIDPIPVGQFIEAALQNPGKGEQKLSMRNLSAADVMPFDPSKRRMKPLGPRKPPMQAAPGSSQYDDMMNPPLEELEGDEGLNDYEGLLYMYDTAAGGLNDIAKALIQMQPGLDPTKQKEAGAIIAKLKAAIRALSA